MYGVMMPGVSAGSDQVGAIDTWTAQVSCPSGAAGADVGAKRSQEQQRNDQGECNPSGHGEPPLHRKRNGSEPRDDTRATPIISGRADLSIRSPGQPTVDLGLGRS